MIGFLKKKKHWLAIPFVIYFILLALLYFRQEKLMYFPLSLEVQEVTERLKEVETKLQVIAELDRNLEALVFKPKDRPPVGTVVYYHGNSGHALFQFRIVPHMVRTLGYQLVVPEYAGFGWRSGKPNEKQIVAEAKSVYAKVRSATPAEQPVIVIGQSLGTSMAVQVAADAKQPPNKVVLLTPFNSVKAVAQEIYWMFPVSSLVKDTYESDRYLDGYKGPIHFMVAGQDNVVGSQSGLKLYEQAKKRGQTFMLWLPEHGHMSWRRIMDTQAWKELITIKNN